MCRFAAYHRAAMWSREQLTSGMRSPARNSGLRSARRGRDNRCHRHAVQPGTGIALHVTDGRDDPPLPGSDIYNNLAGFGCGSGTLASAATIEREQHRWWRCVCAPNATITVTSGQHSSGCGCLNTSRRIDAAKVRAEIPERSDRSSEVSMMGLRATLAPRVEFEFHGSIPATARFHRAC